MCCCGQKLNCIRKDTQRQQRKRDLIHNRGNVLNYLHTSGDLIYKIYKGRKGPENSKNYRGCGGVKVLR